MMNDETKDQIARVSKVALPTLGWLSLVGLIVTGGMLVAASMVGVTVFYEPVFFGLTFLAGVVVSALGVVMVAQRLFAAS